MSWGQNLGDKACVPHKYGVAKNNADIGHNERSSHTFIIGPNFILKNIITFKASAFKTYCHIPLKLILGNSVSWGILPFHTPAEHPQQEKVSTMVAQSRSSDRVKSVKIIPNFSSLILA